MQQQNYVFLLDKDRKPLTPVRPKQARRLLEKEKAAVIRTYPFTLILNKVIKDPTIKPLTIKIDPGSKYTGISLLQGNEVIWGLEIEHRGQQIKNDLESRAAIRRNRRSRHTRYRKPRFNNRTRSYGWLPPSLMHRVQTIKTWIKRLIRFAPIEAIWVESVKFDLTKMQNPELSGVEYQQGTLWGYQVREYLLEKWGRECTYCEKTDVPLQVEHIEPKSKGGSDRVSNLCLACEKCNQKKGSKSIEEFLKRKPNLLKRIKAQQKKPLKDAAAVNSTRNKLVKVLESQKLPVYKSDGATTKYNRISQGLPKEHWIDSACVGDGTDLIFRTNQPLKAKCSGHGTRQKINPDKYGFPRSHKSQESVFFGFKTGDIVKAVIPEGKSKYAGTHFGRVAVRATGTFKLYADRTINSIKHSYCKLAQKRDGYRYSF